MPPVLFSSYDDSVLFDVLILSMLGWYNRSGASGCILIPIPIGPIPIARARNPLSSERGPFMRPRVLVLVTAAIAHLQQAHLPFPPPPHRLALVQPQLLFLRGQVPAGVPDWGLRAVNS